MGNCTSPLPLGERCVPGCDAKYSVVGAFEYNSSGCFNASASCVPNPCAEPLGIPHALAARACAEGAAIPHEGVCTGVCADGYYADPGQLTCRLGQLSPSQFTCLPKPCQAPSTVAFAAAPPCAQGTIIAHQGKCTAQCVEGYLPSPATLDCAFGELSARSFTCAPLGCQAPVGVPRALQDAPCLEGLRLHHGGTCSGQCEPGFGASPAALACGLGALTPVNFTCVPVSCEVPLDIGMAADPPCLEGASIADGAACTPSCQPGFAPTASVLRCNGGVLSPDSFSCRPLNCDAPAGIEGAAAVACTEGNRISHGSACTARCAGGALATPPSLSCGLGVLSPPTFRCLPGTCAAPAGIDQATDVACAEGASIPAGHFCTPQCKEGYEPSAAQLYCASGSLSPHTFECLPKGCIAPVNVTNAADPPCRAGISMSHGDSCATRCQGGLTPFPASLSCGLGRLTPPVFECKASACAAPTGVPFAASPACAEGDSINDGATCTPQCEPGRMASVAALACRSRELTPHDFTCEPAGCRAAPVDGLASPPCEEGHTVLDGFNCTVRCAAGWRPSQASLRCVGSNFTPSGLVCVPMPTEKEPITFPVGTLLGVTLGSAGALCFLAGCVGKCAWEAGRRAGSASPAPVVVKATSTGDRSIASE